MRTRFRRAHKQSPELDITAFMNLMVILVPFLLITAVFSQVNILEMSLPKAADEAQAPEEPPAFLLEIVLRQDVIEVSDRPGRLLKAFPKREDGSYDFQAISKLLQILKSRFPDEQVAMLMLEPDVEYDYLIKMMDVVRVVEVEQNGKTVQAELFPDIALGDAPEVGAGKAK